MRFSTRPALTLCLATSLAVPAASQVALRDALPENTILYLGAPHMDQSLAEMRDMPLMRMWEEPEVQDFLADALQMAEMQWDQLMQMAQGMHENGQLPFKPEELLELRVHGMAAALTKLDLSVDGDDVMPHIGFVAQLDFGNTAESWNGVIHFLLQMLKGKAGDDLTLQETEVAGSKLVTLVPNETKMSLNFGFVGNGIVFGTDHDEVKTVISNLASGQKALSASENFTATFSQLDNAGAEMEFFLQPKPIFDFLFTALGVAKQKGDLPEMIDIDGIARALDALGVHSLKTMGSTSMYTPRGEGESAMSVRKSFMLAPKDQRKGLFATANKSLEMDFLRWVPKDVASFSAMTFDLGSAWDGVVNALKAYDEEQAEQWLGTLAGYEEQFGVNVREDLLGSIGSEFMMWSMPTAAMMMGTPEVTMLLEVPDPERLVSTLETLFKMSEGMVELDKSTRRGIDVYTIQVNYDPTGGGMGMNPLDMFAPTFSFKDGYLVAGFTVGDVKRAFKRMDREDDPSGDIRSNSEFVPYLEQLPQSGVVSLSFQDWKADFESIYQALTGMAAFIPMNDDIPIDLSLLPDVATLTQHLFGSVSWATLDDTGFHAMSQGPWGPEALALLGGGAAAVGGFVAASEQGGW